MIIAGIDEAGYGPRLGPLVVAANTFRLPGARFGPREWPEWSLAPEGLAVCDSKTVYSASRGLACLETAVLAFAGVTGGAHGDLRELLAAAALEGGAEALSRPWYSSASLGLPCTAAAAEIEFASLSVARWLTAEGLEYLGASMCVVDAMRYNALLKRIGNKATLLFGRTAILMRDLWRRFGLEGIRLTVDRHGGRKFYWGLLDVAFSRCDIDVLSEGGGESIYEIRDGDRRMLVRFLVEGESADPAVALSSMWAKYTRELFMRLFNLYWIRRAGRIRATAGYWTDGERFLADLLAAGVVTRAEAQVFTRAR
ncbi:MAG: hypothetical protein ACYTAN_00400 [Planctomycetota bacterium]